MEYTKIPLVGQLGKGKFAICDGDYDGEYLSGYRWYLLPNGYAAREENLGGKQQYVYMHNDVMPKKKGYWIDHIDRNKLNNRSCNLRYVTPSESAYNRHYTDGRLHINLDMTDDEKATIRRLQKKKKELYRSKPEQKKKKAEYDRLRYLSRLAGK